MIHHRKRKLRLPNFSPRSFQSRKSLRRSAFVDQVTVDVNQRGLPRLFPNDVRFPNFLVESASCHTVGFPPAGNFPERVTEAAVATAASIVTSHSHFRQSRCGSSIGFSAKPCQE